MRSLWTCLTVFGVSMFCGIILIGIAVGAIIPKVIDPIAKPFVCKNGTLQITQNTTSYRPGESDTWTTDTCVDSATGNQQDVGSSITLLIWYSAIYNKGDNRCEVFGLVSQCLGSACFAESSWSGLPWERSSQR